MDSKLRRLTILAAVSVLILVTIIVFYLNQDTEGKSNNNSQIKQESEMPAATTDQATNDQVGNNLKGFLSDPTFFDQEENSVLSAAKSKKTTLSLIMTSVEKDIRIQVVNGFGELVSGESFYAEIDGQGQYKDLDKDGIIYVGGLNAGEYFVSLQPCEGYTVPTTASRIQVKDRVEYLAINDISLLIKTEDEIDAEKEDTQQNQAIEDSDNTVINSIRSFDNAKVGIDVSKWNGEIDWDKVKNAGIEFAIIRVGYRGSRSGSLVEDPFFEQNLKGAKRAGLDVGLYFFSQAVTDVEAVEEASAVLELLGENSISLPVFIDSESAGGNGRADGLEADIRTEICEAFCRTIENAGLQSGIYASRNWFNNNLYTAKLDKYTIWLAEYRKVPLYQGYYNLWQYTSKGKIDGIDGNVDLDILYY